MQHQQQDAAFTVLSLVSNHQALNSNPRILCAAVRTCKAWRQAVQQCGACNTEVEVSLSASLPCLCSFAQWLVKHAALVKSMTINSHAYDAPKTVDGLPWELHLSAAQQLLQQAMQLAEALPAAAAVSVAASAAGQTTAAALSAAQQQQQQQAHSRVPTISSITLRGSTCMLAALPANSLTQLHMLGQLVSVQDGPAVSAALARLSNLQQLHVALWEGPYSCLAGVAQLTQLTLLDVSSQGSDSYQPLQQLLEQPLPLQVLHLQEYNTLPPLLDLSQLSQLRELHCPELYDAVFPPQLQQLVLGADSSTNMLTSALQLTQLQRLTLEGIDDDSQAELMLPRQLAQLPALRELVLKYSTLAAAAHASTVWPQLPQLCELDINMSMCESASRQRWGTVINGVAACTYLTKLDLTACGRSDGAGDEGEHAGGRADASCAKLAGLTNLKDLSIYILTGSEFPTCGTAGDTLALTALTGLTGLTLRGAGAAVGDEAAAALAGSCRQLCHLDLTDCNLVSMACLTNVRYLTQLTELQLQTNSGLTQQGLMLLTGLKRLENLKVDRNAEVTDEVMQSFWAAVKGQLR